MHRKSLDWREFEIDMESLHGHVQSVAGACYLGSVAHESLDLIFSRSLSAQEEASIQEYLDSLTESHEREKLDRASKRTEAVKIAKDRLVHSDLLTLTAGERKILVGLPLSASDQDELVAKYIR